MSFKYKKLEKIKFKNGNSSQKLHVNLKGNLVNTVFVNTLRRVCLDLIPFIAFNKDDIDIMKNTSIYNNDIIRLRLSTFPLIELKNTSELINHINDFEQNKYSEDSFEKLSIFFSKNNDTNEVINVTTDDCQFYLGDKKIDSIYKVPLLITKLKQGEEIRGSCKSSIGIGLHNGIYCSVQRCCYEELKDNEFIFKIESRGQISEEEIMKRACMIIVKKLQLIKERFSDKIINGNEIELLLQNEDHTLGNLITSYLQNNNNVTYAGYKIDHPLQREVEIILKTNGSKKLKTIFLETLDTIISHFEKFEKKIK